jgi:two-component system phosphate regulon sensor histidine kinase PhoR
VAVHQYLDAMRRLGDTPEVNRERRTWLDRCLVRTREMQQIINDWLTLASMEGSCLSGGKEPVNLKDTLGDTLKRYESMATDCGVSLRLDMPGADYSVSADRNCMSVLFDNLIENAVKYNRPGGSVTVAGARTAGEIVVEVTDTGIGIPEKHRPFIFDEFYRVKDESGKKTSGSGLGLPICRRIVSEHGGSITFESVVGTGSTFRVRLTAQRERPDSRAPGPQTDEVHHAQDTGG